MQYGHCVVSATATAISSLYFSGIAPPRTTASSNATNALNASGASSAYRAIFFMLFMSYMLISFKKYFDRDPAIGWSHGCTSGFLMRTVDSAQQLEQCTSGTPRRTIRVDSCQRGIGGN